MEALAVALALVLGLAYLSFEKKLDRCLGFFLVYVLCIEGPLKILNWKSSAYFFTYTIRDFFLYSILLKAMLSGYFSMKNKVQSLPRMPMLSHVVLFVLWCFLMVLRYGKENFLISLIGLRPHLEMVPLLFFGYYMMDSKTRFKKFFKLLVSCAVLNSIVSIFQFLKGPEWLKAFHPGYAGWMQDLNRTAVLSDNLLVVRPPALGSDMGFAGAVAIFSFPALILMIVLGKKFGFARRSGHGLVFWVLLFGLFSSQSRSSYALSVMSITLTLTALFFLSMGRVARMLHIALLVTILMSISLAYVHVTHPKMMERFQSVITVGDTLETITKKEESRKRTLVDDLKVMSTEYFWGYGLGKAGAAAGTGFGADGKDGEQLNSENQILFDIGEIGVPGLIIFFFFHLRVFMFGFVRIGQVRSVTNRLYLMFPLITMGLLFVCWPFGNLVTVPASALFWFCAGVILRFGKYVGDGRIYNHRQVFTRFGRYAQSKRAGAASAVDARPPGGR